MKITISGSSKFAKEMVEYKKLLEDLGHEVSVHDHYIAMANGNAPDLMRQLQEEHANLKIEHDYIRDYYNRVVKSDAILVLNFDKNGIANYVGGNTLMEIGFAHVHNKKIFLLNDIPDMQYKEEIEAMQPTILKNDLTQIS